MKVKTKNNFFDFYRINLTEKGNIYDDDYNPFDHRDPNGNSTMGSLAHLLKSSLGSGILAMPMAFRNAGLLFGAIGTLVVGFLCTHCVHILVSIFKFHLKRLKFRHQKIENKVSKSGRSIILKQKHQVF